MLKLKKSLKLSTKKEVVIQTINQFLIWYNEQIQTNKQQN